QLREGLHQSMFIQALDLQLHAVFGTEARGPTQSSSRPALERHTPGNFANREFRSCARLEGRPRVDVQIAAVDDYVQLEGSSSARPGCECQREPHKPAHQRWPYVQSGA